MQIVGQRTINWQRRKLLIQLNNQRQFDNQ